MMNVIKYKLKMLTELYNKKKNNYLLKSKN